MALEDIIKKIAEDAEQTAAEVEKEAEREVSRIEKRIQSHVSEVEKEGNLQTERLAQAEYRSRLAAYRQKIKYRLDEKKRQSLDHVFDVALERLENLSGDEREEFLRVHLASLEISDGNYTVLGSKSDVRIATQFLREAYPKSTFAEEIREGSGGGCQISSETFSHDLRFSRLLIEKRASLESQVASQLFATK